MCAFRITLIYIGISAFWIIGRPIKPPCWPPGTLLANPLTSWDPADTPLDHHGRAIVDDQLCFPQHPPDSGSNQIYQSLKCLPAVDHDHEYQTMTMTMAMIDHQTRQQRYDSSSDIKDCKYCFWCRRPWKLLLMLSRIVARSFIMWSIWRKEIEAGPVQRRRLFTFVKSE